MVIYKKNRPLIFALIVLFVITRALGLHAHGHVASAHEHPGAAFTPSAHHAHEEEKTHIVSNINEAHDISHAQETHGKSTFEIDHSVIVKKQVKNVAEQILFVLALLVIAYISSGTMSVVPKPFSNRLRTTKTPYLNQPLLRAPPRNV